MYCGMPKINFQRTSEQSSLNMVVFTKILKKFDKVSNQQTSTSYLKALKRSHFISSDKVVRLMDEVESIFTRHFANSDRKKTMKFLRRSSRRTLTCLPFLLVYQMCNSWRWSCWKDLYAYLLYK